MESTDSLKFILDTTTFAYPIVDIFVNDKNIIDIIRDIELPFATKEDSPSLAGAYAGLNPIYLYQSLTEDNKEKSVNILGCECGEEGCWPMQIEIKKDGNLVYWNNFRQPYRLKEENLWDYSGFPGFIFECGDYSIELEKLKSLIS